VRVSHAIDFSVQAYTDKAREVLGAEMEFLELCKLVQVNVSVAFLNLVPH